MVHVVEEIIQDTYTFYNKSTKRQRRLRELAQMQATTTLEDKAIESLEKSVKETLENGIQSFCKSFF